MFLACVWMCTACWILGVYTFRGAIRRVHSNRYKLLESSLSKRNFDGFNKKKFNQLKMRWKFRRAWLYSIALLKNFFSSRSRYLSSAVLPAGPRYQLCFALHMLWHTIVLCGTQTGSDIRIPIPTRACWSYFVGFGVIKLLQLWSVSQHIVQSGEADVQSYTIA